MMQTENMRLTVLNVANPFAHVGPDAAGEAEQVLSALDRALVAAGHTSLVAACEGSSVAGRLFPVPFLNRKQIGELERRWYYQHLRAVIDRALLLHCVDVVHMHGIDFCEYEFPSEIPVLVTLHMPTNGYQAERLRMVAKHVQLCSVSESQRRSFPQELRKTPVIEYGVNLPQLHPNQRRADFAIVLAGDGDDIESALRAGTLAGTSVMVGGGTVPASEHQTSYGRAGVDARTPRGATGAKHLFLGPVGLSQRFELLSKARCLLDPARATGSPLLAMEALACGTPVIGYRTGPVAEIVEDGLTGFLIENVEQMAEAIRHARSLSPLACRRAAEQQFSANHMTESYLRQYRAMVSNLAWQQVCA